MEKDERVKKERRRKKKEEEGKKGKKRRKEEHNGKWIEVLTKKNVWWTKGTAALWDRTRSS